eukprot:566464-Pyramimonas_sp.AAC.1
MPTLPLQQFLLRRDDDRITQECQARQAVDRTQTIGEGVEWPKLHRDHLSKKGLNRSLVETPAHIRSSLWCTTLPRREQECLGFAVRCGVEKGWALKSVDLHPSIDRLAFGRDNE